MPLHSYELSQFGSAVSIHGNMIAIGAHGDNTDKDGNNTLFYSGSVYIYKKDSTNLFQLEEKLLPNTRNQNQSFGSAVALTDEHLLVGAFGESLDSLENNPLYHAGAVYVFKNCSASFFEITDTTCGSYTLNNETFYESGTYEQILRNEAGCDSILTLHLTIRDTFYYSQHVFVCKGNSIQVGTNTYTDTGIYLDTFKMINSCDSIIETRLSNYPSYNDTQIVSICFGDTFFVNNNHYFISGFYSDTLESVNGCDSIINTALTVLDTVHFIQNIAICQGDSFKVHLNNYTVSGTYYDTLVSSNGCDSIVTTQLTVKSKYQSQDSIFICSGESVIIDGREIYTSGIYTTVYQAANGCDSLVHTYLFVNPPINPEIQTKSTELVAYPSGATYQWIDCLRDEPIDGETNQTFTPQNNGEYAVILTVGDCTETSPCAKYNKQADIFLPTAFSPNGDGVNDVYSPVYQGWELRKMQVFNRWGEMLFESTSPNATWDGTYKGQPAPQGVYAILLVFQALETQGLAQTIEQKNVSVQLVR